MDAEPRGIYRMGNFTNPSVSDFKQYFTRDFQYGTTSDKVTDTDISTALGDSSVFVNPDLYQTQDIYDTGFLLLGAHFLVMNLRAANNGLQGQFPWMQQSKSVGSVAESFAIPQRIMDNPEYAMLTKTYYGAKFLFMILPQLSGQIFTVCGRTHA